MLLMLRESTYSNVVDDEVELFWMIVYFPALKMVKIRSLEEVLRILQEFFGQKIDNYPILLFASVTLLIWQFWECPSHLSHATCSSLP